MHSRLHSVLTLLLACLMLGVGTQSAVCELACNLGGKIQCHGAATPSAQPSSGDKAMAAMPAMHCPGMMHTNASKSASAGARVESRDIGMCRHLSPPATVSSIADSEAVQAVHWIVVEPVIMQAMVVSNRIKGNSEAPPLPPPVDLLNASLRV